MKTYITLLIALSISISTFAQQGINYKAIIKDDLGNVIAGQEIDVKFSIIEITDTTTTVVYTEDHPDIMTDTNGIIILNIGEGTTSDDFSNIDWGSGSHSLKTEIDLDNDTIYEDLGTTAFKAVPFAKHAEIAANVFSGDYNDLTNQPIITPATGLEQITELNPDTGSTPHTGWRLIGRYAEAYGQIGENAIDFSYAGSISPPHGATGKQSIAMGYSTIASGEKSTAMGYITNASEFASTAMGAYSTASGFYSIAMGYLSNASGYGSIAMLGGEASGFYSIAVGGGAKASGQNSIAMGSVTNAESYSSTAIGRYNIGGFTNNTGTDNDGDSSWLAADPLFEIGNGNSDTNRNNALTVLKNGTITAPSLTNSLINTAGNNALITKEYAEANYLSQQSSNLLPIAYGIVDSNGDVLSGTGNFTAFLSGNVFIIDVNNTQSLSYNNNVCLITPISTLSRTSSIIITDGNGDTDKDLNVRIFNSSGTQVETTFQFVIYKL